MTENQKTSPTDYAIRTAAEAALSAINQVEHVYLSERDTLRVLELLESPPEPNEKLVKAARAMPLRP